MGSAPSSSAAALASVRFEVFGKVQGVFFRACTKERAEALRLVGTVENTPRGTVLGVVQGERDAVERMKAWLAQEGSPASRIDRCDFADERPLDRLEFDAFDVVRRRQPRGT